MSDTLVSSTNFTLKDLEESLAGEKGYAEVYYVGTDGEERSYHWGAEKDENGYPVIARVVVHTPDDDDYDEDTAVDLYNEFQYEGGYVYPLGYFKVVTSGNLGDGHEAWALFEHQQTGRLFRLGGYYSSWDVGEMDNWDEVEPAEVHVVRFKSVTGDTVYEHPTVDTTKLHRGQV